MIKNKSNTGLLILLLICLAAATARSQTSVAKREQLLTAAREIIATARYAALITRNANGAVDARTMDPFEPTSDMTIWFGTNSMSRKVREIRRDPRVTIYYIDPVAQAYVTIKGRARLVNDPAAKRRWWKEEWSAFYPDREKHYLLIEVRPERLEVVNTKTGLTGDAESWAPPFVTFRRR